MLSWVLDGLVLDGMVVDGMVVDGAVLDGLVLAHGGRALAPHDLAGAWTFDPVVVIGLIAVVWAYRRGAVEGPRRPPRWRQAAFFGGLLAIVVALVSPLDALSGSLASAHMVQHVLLILVAAPALVLSAPLGVMTRGLPPGARRRLGRTRGSVGLSMALTRRWWRPSVVWLAHAGVLWLWHASVPYGLALRVDGIHAVEHATFFGTALLFWGVVVGSRGAAQIQRGQGVLLVFGMAMQSVLLSALLTFATSAWYAGYATTTQVWGMTPLADQQLAGVIMWVPAGLVYLGALLALLSAWFREVDADDAARAARSAPVAPAP